MVAELDGKRMKVKKGAESIFINLKDKSSVEQLQQLLDAAHSGQDDAKEKI